MYDKKFRIFKNVPLSEPKLYRIYMYFVKFVDLKIQCGDHLWKKIQYRKNLNI